MGRQGGFGRGVVQENQQETARSRRPGPEVRSHPWGQARSATVSNLGLGVGRRVVMEDRQGVARSRRPGPEVRRHPGCRGRGPGNRRLSEPRLPRCPGTYHPCVKPSVGYRHGGRCTKIVTVVARSRWPEPEASSPPGGRGRASASRRLSAPWFPRSAGAYLPRFIPWIGYRRRGGLGKSARG